MLEKVTEISLENYSKKHIQELKGKLVGQIKPFAGHQLFEVDLETGFVTKAEYKELDTYHKGVSLNATVIIKPNCAYISCLNARNVPKHFNKKSNGTKPMSAGGFITLPR